MSENEINNNKKKKLKRSSEQIAIEIEEKEAHFEKMIEEHKKILELTQREYTNIVRSAETKLIKSKKDIILEAGRYLENNLDIVKNNSPNYICRRLKEKFKGIISPTQIWYHCPDKWKSVGYVTSGRKGGLNKSSSGLENPSRENEEPLTEYEQKYVELHEQKVHHNENMQALIDYYLGMTEEQKTIIFGKVKRKGSEFHNALLDEAYNNMLRIVKSLNDADIPALLADIRFLKTILTKVADMALTEHEQRKRNKDMLNQ
jgi:hypothetical protein